MTEIQIEPGSIGHLTAAADYSAANAARGLACIQTNQTAVLCSALGQRAIGVMQEDAASGQAILVGTSGVWPVRYGGTVAVGDLLVPAANGRLISKSSAGAGVAAGHVLAVALYAGVDGDFHGAFLTGQGTLSRGIPYNFNVPLVGIAGDRNILTAIPIGAMFGAGRIRTFDAFVVVVGTGTGAAIDFNLEIDGTNVTGGVVSATLANTATGGTRLTGTAITAGNAFTASSVLDVEADHTTDFTAGQLLFQIVID